MSGLKLAVLYSYGCNMGVITGIDRFFLDFLKNPDAPEQERVRIKSFLESLNPYASYCSLARLIKEKDVFVPKVVRAYWLGNGQAEKGLSHNFQVLREIESMRVDKKLPVKTVNKMLGCLVSFGRIIKTEPDGLLVSHYGLSFKGRRGGYVWKTEKKEIKRGFVAEPEEKMLVSIHFGSAREEINRRQAGLLREITLQAIRAIRS